MIQSQFSFRACTISSFVHLVLMQSFIKPSIICLAMVLPAGLSGAWTISPQKGCEEGFYDGWHIGHTTVITLSIHVLHSQYTIM